MMLERDPEIIGEPSYEEIELDMDVRDSIHTFDPGPDGRCRAYLIRHGAQGNVCNSTQRSSVFHDDPDAYFREQHDHGGGDCMCFEFESEYEDTTPLPDVKTYTMVLKVTTFENPYKWDWLILLDLARSEGEGVEVLGIIPS